jgi:nucleoside-triphosphatase THEP1
LKVTSVVLTGEVHIGKTTVCRAVAELTRERGYCVRGILTPPILDPKGRRLGIEAIDLASGERRELARVWRGRRKQEEDWNWDGPQMGPYFFDPAVLEWAHDAIARGIALDCDLLIIDEIGRLELEQGLGFSQVLDLLGTSIVVRSLLVVRASLLEAFHQRLPSLEFVTFIVTPDNRADLAAEIAQRLFLS